MNSTVVKDANNKKWKVTQITKPRQLTAYARSQVIEHLLRTRKTIPENLGGMVTWNKNGMANITPKMILRILLDEIDSLRSKL